MSSPLSGSPRLCPGVRGGVLQVLALTIILTLTTRGARDIDGRLLFRERDRPLTQPTDPVTLRTLRGLRRLWRSISQHPRAMCGQGRTLGMRPQTRRTL